MEKWITAAISHLTRSRARRCPQAERRTYRRAVRPVHPSAGWSPPTRFPSLWTCVRGRSARSVIWSCGLVRSSADALEPRRMRPELRPVRPPYLKVFKSVRNFLPGTPAMASPQEGRNDPCRGPGWAGEPMAESRKTGQLRADRTRQCPHYLPTRDPGQHDRDEHPGRPRMAPENVAPDPPDRRGDERRDPAGRRAAGTLDR